MGGFIKIDKRLNISDSDLYYTFHRRYLKEVTKNQKNIFLNTNFKKLRLYLLGLK